MTRPANGSNSQNSNSQDATEVNIEQALTEMERSLHDLKMRYAQVHSDQLQQRELQARLSQAKQEYRATKLRSLKTEIDQLQQRLLELEVALESKLISSTWVRELFWQIVRFVSLGVVLGWVLRSCAG
ncbi:MAG: DUF2203 domain-containing protein [Kaiparowitsia implicata GSE-PSE-MK54-09C]|jgi:L-lactate utilization protein LutC|nr:DUF2203 domain-containing protein [Kaiparowitsia implicata GSE-PSE-MK54-09C]